MQTGRTMISYCVLLTLFMVFCIQNCQAFRDCPKNRKINLGFLRRCCEGDEIPKGCECFEVTTKSNFTNSMFVRPMCQTSLDVKFYLYTRASRKSPSSLKTSDNSLRVSTYQASKPTKVLVHGWLMKAQNNWYNKAKDEILALEDVNVILVDWKKGSRRRYLQSLANTRSVGAILANLIVHLAKQPGGDLKNFHLTGHSLGAHLVGYTGKEIYRLTSQKVGRITGLDPASSGFENFPPNVRLDKSDALFVDVVHTDAVTLINAGCGFRTSIGHADFFPNGGSQQPACRRDFLGKLSYLGLKGLSSSSVCSHMMSLNYFIHSVSTCRYEPPSGDSECTMGYHTSPSCRGNFYPVTGANKPFC